MLEVIACYTYPHHSNRGKVEKVLELLREYRRTARKIAKLHWKHFFKSKGRLNEFLRVEEVDSRLLERYKYVCSRQLCGTLKSFVFNIQNRVSEVIWNSSLSKEDKLILSYANSKGLWLDFSLDKVKVRDGKELEVKDYHRKLIEKIFKHVLSTWRKPSFKHISMHLDGKVFCLKLKQEGKAKSFDYWLSLATLEKRKRVLIPLRTNTYAEAQEGEWKNTGYRRRRKHCSKEGQRAQEKGIHTYNTDFSNGHRLKPPHSVRQGRPDGKAVFELSHAYG